MKNKYIGTTLLISLLTLMVGGVVEGFTGQPFLGTAGDMLVGMIVFVTGIWGAILLIK